MNTFDIEVFRKINDLAGLYPWLDRVWIFIAVASPFLLAAYLLISWFYQRNSYSRRGLVLSVVAAIAAEIISRLSGFVYSHPQPFASLEGVHKLISKQVGNSFPSDHTTVFFAAMTMLFLFYRDKKLKWLFPLIAILVGISRIWVGVHYPSDVIAGGVIGIISSIGIYYAANSLEDKFIKK